MDEEKPELKLIGEDGNAFFIICRAESAAKEFGWSQEKIDKFIEEAESGDYNNVLTTCRKYFNIK